MCLAVPAQVLSIHEAYANVDIMGIESQVNIQLIENLSMGDYVLVHAGCGIQRIDKEYFSYLQNEFQKILDEAGRDE